MRSPFYFIVEPLEGKRYKNSKEIEGIDFITSSSQENHMASNREAVVISTPLKYKGPVKKGDILLVHHNVFKFYYDMRGREKSGKSYFKDNLFFVDNEQFFLYKQNDKWFSHSKYCFVEPIPSEEYFLIKNFNEEPLMGRMKYSNTYLESKGVQQGMKVGFKPESEYEFKVDGQKLYRMFDHQITLML
tara:strand:- start:673 stop:1236 length:564 start_codon:yes stop_codon:yes gene_type:complete